MSLVVPCPGCPTKLSAPESAAGKQIRCPKCKAVVPVPAFIPAEEVPVVDAKAAPAPKAKTKPAVTDDEEDEDDTPPPRKKSRRDEEEDEDDERPRKKKKRPAYDDDDEDDERPRRKRPRPAKGGGGGVKVALIVVGVLLLVGGVGLGVYMLVGKGGFARAPVPAGWKQYDYPQSGFRAAFPSEPTVFGANMQGGFGGGPLPGGIEIPQLESMFSYSTGGGGFGARDRGGVTVSVEVNRYSTAIPRASRDLMTRNGNNRFGGGAVKKVRWLGGDAVELATGGTLMRMVVLEKAVIVVQISGPNGARAKPEEENGFFDNFELIK